MTRQRRDTVPVTMPAYPSVLLLVAVLVVAMSGPLSAAEDLPEAGSGAAQGIVSQIIAELELDNAVGDGRLAVALVTLDGREATSLGMVNGHRMMYAASLPKIAILYGAAVALDRERLAMTDALREDIVAMIRRSCNACATRVLDAIGRDFLLELLQSDPYRFYDAERGGGLWVGKDYAKAGAFRREPLQGLSHSATAWQVARWYYQLFSGQLASPKQTELMLDALSEPAISHKFVRSLAARETDALYRKSGTWRQFHSDSVLVVVGSGGYILVALAADRRGDQWLEALAAQVHDAVIE
jgi:beta-lactamase class A